jgi:pyruvate/2-oxoglutarate dehydrogenase complex dihydrolipoamide dehydrogenase (E3) component
MGGDCLNTGCVPSKALIRSAKLLSHMARSKEFGIASARADFDFATVMERVQRVIRTVEPHDSVERYTGLGVEVARGHGEDRFAVGGRDHRPRWRDAAPEHAQHRHRDRRAPLRAADPGIEEVGYLTSDTLWNLRELPKRLVVLGGGPIGSEMTQAFARFGSQVTQVEMGPRLMIREDPEVSELVARRFVPKGSRSCSITAPSSSWSKTEKRS